MHGIRNIKINERLEKQAPGCSFWNTLPHWPARGAASSATIGKADHWRVLTGTADSKNTGHSCDPGTRKALDCYCGHLSSLKKLGTGQRAGLYQEKSIKITEGQILRKRQWLPVKVFAFVNRWCNFELNDLRTLSAL